MNKMDTAGLQVLTSGDVMVLLIAVFAAMTKSAGWEASAQAIRSSLFFIMHWAAICLGVFWTLETFGNSWQANSLWFQTVLVGVLVSSLVAFCLSYVFPVWDGYRIILVAALPLELFLVSCWRFFFMAFWTTNGTGRVLLFADDAEKTDLAARLHRSYSGRTLKVDVGNPNRETAERHLAGSGIDFICIGSGLEPDVRKVISDRYLWENRRIVIVPQALELALRGAKVNRLGDSLALDMEPPGLSAVQKASKRLLDLAITVASLPVVAPLWLLISLAIGLTSPGSCLIKQERVAQGGKAFTLWKFRTMVKDAESRTGPILASAEDPRITKVGKILRAARLDELPQLVNVLKGEMSLVGPRPERPHFVRQFTQNIPHYRHRFQAKPGLTGLAQVMGTYATDARDKLGYDLLYIREYSLWLDLKILLLTLMVIATPDLARGVPKEGSHSRKSLDVF